MNWLNRIKQMMGDSVTPAQASVQLNFASYGNNQALNDSDYAHHFYVWRNNGIVNKDDMLKLSPVIAENQLTNRNGYAREFALLVLIAHEHKPSLAGVIARLNDYVDNIRRVASKTVLQWLWEVDIEELLVVLPALFNLQKQSRTNSDLILSSATKRLFDPINQPVLLKGIEHKNHKVSALCWELCRQLYCWNSYEKIYYSLKTNDILIKHAMCSEVGKLTLSELKTFIELLPKIKLMQLRRVFLLHLRRHKLLDEIACIKIALWDKSYGIRWMGRL